MPRLASAAGGILLSLAAWLVVPVVSGERSFERSVNNASEKQVNVTQDGAGTLTLATDHDLDRARAVIAGNIDKAKASIASSLQESFLAIELNLQQQASAIQQAARDLLQTSLHRLASLQLQERRLRLAVRHGVHGRCCCKSASKDGCEWVDVGALAGYGQLCPVGYQDYIDHFTQLKQSGQPASMDSLVDACLASGSWEVHMNGIPTVSEGLLPSSITTLIDSFVLPPSGLAPSIVAVVSTPLAAGAPQVVAA